MNVIWKRPDGFIGSVPSDFRVLNINDQCSIWIHKEDVESFPFRLAGGWKHSDDSKKINQLVNALDKEDGSFEGLLKHFFDHSISSDKPGEYLDKTIEWLNELKNLAKGSTWEIEIMTNVFDALIHKIEKNRGVFLKN